MNNKLILVLSISIIQLILLLLNWGDLGNVHGGFITAMVVYLISILLMLILMAYLNLKSKRKEWYPLLIYICINAFFIGLTYLGN